MTRRFLPLAMSSLALTSACDGHASDPGQCAPNIIIAPPFINVLVTDAKTGLAVCNASVVYAGPTSTVMLQERPASGDASCLYEIEAGATVGVYTIGATAPGFAGGSETITLSEASCGSVVVTPSPDAGWVNTGEFRGFVIPLVPQP